MSMTANGRCLCGAVTLELSLGDAKVGACHCTMCRTWGGGPLLALESVAAMTLHGEKHVATYASSEWAERGFCSRCGTHLFYRLKEGGHVAVPVGLIDDGRAWRFEAEIFVDEKPAFYDFANPTHKMTGAEVFAAFARQE
ncbi:GFA family protein [Halomonas sp. 328]|uniref:GFA family protein n=1 Tax=Halomonas sp. 328 TaxID=2776704 RepID=UPI0018A7374A|nr:GFA family protein [Halomonas sp. 328]MBF8223349.1 GFA family protein [Halomonas sp. 328]